MKLVLIAIVALVAVAVAAPPGAPAPVSSQQAQKEPPKILRSEFDQQPDGAYAYSFETEDGIQRQENGELKEVVDEENKPQNVVVVKGSYSYTDSEGHPQTITYYADETGFHAEGDAIPKVPVARR